jgi:glutaredoxin-related protein
MKLVTPAVLLASLSSLLLLAVSSALSGEAVTSRQAPNPVITAMANGMTLLKPIFAAEAKLQASLLGSKVLDQDVSQEIASEVKASNIVVYTYGLSPFSTEAVSILKGTGYDFTTIEVGAEWFLLNGKDSVKRVLLSEFVDNGATSLPKVFVGGKCIGGCAELAQSVQSGEFDLLVNSGKKKMKNFFSFL